MPRCIMPYLSFGPSLVLSGMLHRVASRLSHTFLMMCMISRLWSVWRYFQYGRSQKTDLTFHTPRNYRVHSIENKNVPTMGTTMYQYLSTRYKQWADIHLYRTYP